MYDNIGLENKVKTVFTLVMYNNISHIIIIKVLND